MKRTCYAERITQASDRFEAADLVRAMGCYCAAHIHQSEAERLDIVVHYEGHAQALERDFAADEDSDPMTEDEHPWREWLREWGFITD